MKAWHKYADLGMMAVVMALGIGLAAATGITPVFFLASGIVIAILALLLFSLD